MKTRLTLAVAAAETTQERVTRYIEALGSSGLTTADEVVIAATGSDSLTAVSIGAENVTLIKCDRASSLFDLWGQAMGNANGEHVAVLDIRDGLSSGWVDAWARTPQPNIVCGPVEMGHLEAATSRACFMSEYGQFFPPWNNSAAEIPGNNVVFPRAMLPPRDELLQAGFLKSFHVERLRARGPIPIVVQPEMVVVFQREYRLRPYLVRRFLHGRCYGGRRLSMPNAPHRLWCVGFVPLLPALRTGRVLQRVLGKPKHPPRLLSALPAIALGEFAWALGEGTGYVRGAGCACEQVQ